VADSCATTSFKRSRARCSGLGVAPSSMTRPCPFRRCLARHRLFAGGRRAVATATVGGDIRATPIIVLAVGHDIPSAVIPADLGVHAPSRQGERVPPAAISGTGILCSLPALFCRLFGRHQSSQRRRADRECLHSAGRRRCVRPLEGRRRDGDRLRRRCRAQTDGHDDHQQAEATGDDERRADRRRDGGDRPPFPMGTVAVLDLRHRCAVGPKERSHFFLSNWGFIPHRVGKGFPLAILYKHSIF